MILVDHVKRFSALRIVAWGVLLVCLGFAMLPLGQGLAFAALAMAVVTVGEMLMMPWAAGLVANRIPAGA